LFNLDDNFVDYINDPPQLDGMPPWDGVEGLIWKGAEKKFGEGTDDFLREAYRRKDHMKRSSYEGMACRIRRDRIVTV
jgi:hypothetical protein